MSDFRFILRRLRHGVIATITVLAAGAGVALAAQSFSLIHTNVTWAYRKGTTEASAPDPAAWRMLSFNDGAWPRGAATFYYGESIAGGTQLADMQNSYSTLFLRRTFVVTNVADLASLELNAVCDDGFIAWINGVEVARYNAPADGPWFSSLASANATPDPAVFNRWPLPPPPAYLVSGANVLAVQVFNVSLGSSDLVFDAELLGTPAERVAPVIAAVSPPGGSVTDLREITISFSEPVAGVDAGDLMLNEVPCVAVVGGGATYTFTAPPVAHGTVSVSWDPRCGIADLGNPRTPFDPFGPGARWVYEYFDPTAPRVVGIFPRPEAVVRRLAAVEVVFDRPVTGVDAADLLIGGRPATNVTGVAAGPYLFRFAPQPGGLVDVAWAPAHGITDEAPEPVAFGGGAWGYRVNPGLPAPGVIISEFVAENVSGLKDEDQDAEDWIELWNRGGTAVNLEGWSLTDDARVPGRWRFPSLVLQPDQRLIVFASGKDRRGSRLHTNFKLAIEGEYLGLFSPEALSVPASEVAPKYPPQRNDVSYGLDSQGRWRYFAVPTPGQPNGDSTITDTVAPVRFSVPRGYFNKLFNLSLATATPGAEIRYTTNGSVPTLTNGLVYTGPLPITATRIIRAAAFQTNLLPSPVETHTYLYNIAASRRTLPALSLVTASNHLYGPSGIMEVNPRNTTKRGVAWERPVSVEFIKPEDNSGFQVDCGLRLQGGDYVRSRYNYRTSELPFNKYSFRLYFRGDYGPGRLEYPLFPETTQRSFDTIVLRAGMNDHTNPFLTDEFVRTLARDCGQPSPVGTFVHLFINGVYKGYYNPCERFDTDFLNAYHGDSPRWDAIAQGGEIREGDAAAWNALKNLVRGTNMLDPTKYLTAATRLDLTNFVDYLCPLIYADNDDWPHNNWRAARDKAANGPFRFYVWDAEWAFGLQGHSVSWNTVANQLSTTSPPWGTAEIATIFTALRRSPEFQLLFADRVHRHFFNGGALTDARIKARYEQVRARLNNSVSGFDNRIGATWIPQRRRFVLDHLGRAGLAFSTNAPGFSQFGGRVPAGYALTMTNLNGDIYFTTNGTDPRIMFSGDVAPTAVRYTQPLVIGEPVQVKARSLAGTNWSALTEATFEVDLPPLPLRITEINYHPPGGEEYEFIELTNLSPLPINAGGVTLEGVTFRFPENTMIGGGARLVLIPNDRPAAFAQRYPGVAVFGQYAGTLSNSGERLALVDREGRTLQSVDYRDNGGWPEEADGGGASLEIVDPLGDPDDPANWRASATAGGSPGAPNAAVPMPVVRLNEIAADVRPGAPSGGRIHDWIELHNAGATAVDLAGWSLSDGGPERRFVFPRVLVPAHGYLVVSCAATDSPAPGLRTGFGLAREGESVFLADAAGRRVDAVGFGPQIPGFTLGRVDPAAGWRLSEPTPGAVNEAAALAEPADLVVNELLSNSVPGADDWIELHNRHPALPVELRGLSVGTSNQTFRITTAAFVAPSGFVVLRADAQPGPNHVDFRLPSPRGSVMLYDTLGRELNRLTYSTAPEGVSFGRLPDGSDLTQFFANSASPGASNYVSTYTGAVLNEVLARSTGAAADWIELQNPNPTVFALAGMSLGLDQARPGMFVFPTGASIPAGGFLRIWCDDTRPAAAVLPGDFNTGIALSARGGGVYLFSSAGQVVDSVEYGFQLPDQSIGRSGGTWTLLAHPTPGAFNSAPAALGDPLRARLNEWMAAGDEDWVEVFNLAAEPVNLGGFRLTDDPSLAGQTNHTVRPLTLVPPDGVVKWDATGAKPPPAGELPFRLDRWGETLRLYDPGFAVVDSVDFLVQEPRVSEGRFPDGADTVRRFDRTPSPGLPNYLPLETVVINEVLTHTDPPLEDAIEVVNLGDHPAPIGGWWLSDDPMRPRKFRVPAGTQLAPGGFAVWYEESFGPASGATDWFRFDPDRGGIAVLSATDVTGALTGYRSLVRFGALDNGVSFGRYRTTVGDDYTVLSARTFGQDSPANLTQFRRGRGAPNAYPQVGPVVINEILFQPAPDANGNEDADLEFVELLNISSAPVSLVGTNNPPEYWRLTDGVELALGPRSLAPGNYVVLVRFDPATDGKALDRFERTYGFSPTLRGILVGPFTGKLANEGETLVLTRPGELLPLPGGGRFVPQLEVERIAYGSRPPWPAGAAGRGLSLQRRDPTAYGNDPANWHAHRPTPGRANAAPGGDSDGDGLPDDWETRYGLDPFSALGGNGADGDPDGDGLTNLEEFRAGTDPSALTVRITRITAQSGVVRLWVNVAAGRLYRVETSDQLDGAWRPLTDFGPRAQAAVVSLAFTFPDAGRQRYFRAVLVP